MNTRSAASLLLLFSMPELRWGHNRATARISHLMRQRSTANGSVASRGAPAKSAAKECTICAMYSSTKAQGDEMGREEKAPNKHGVICRARVIATAPITRKAQVGHCVPSQHPHVCVCVEQSPKPWMVASFRSGKPSKHDLSPHC